MVATDSTSSGTPYDWLIPMQPSPMAETSSPCRPSVRFSSIVSLSYVCGLLPENNPSILLGDPNELFPLSERYHGHRRHLFPRSCSSPPGTEDQRLRGVPQERHAVGAPPALPDLRTRRLLRQLPGQACHQARSPVRAPGHSVLRAGRGLGLVLRGVPRAGTVSARPARMTPGRTAFTVLAAISFCHFLNDMMQALLPAMYPMLKQDFGLDFGQVGLITLTFQLTASLLQPA